jgi:hypothetical protein
MTKKALFSPQFLHFLKILTLYIIGYFLASHYRPYQNSLGFFDFGLADSGVGLVSIIDLTIEQDSELRSILENHIKSINNLLLKKYGFYKVSF